MLETLRLKLTVLLLKDGLGLRTQLRIYLSGWVLGALDLQFTVQQNKLTNKKPLRIIRRGFNLFNPSEDKKSERRVTSVWSLAYWSSEEGNAGEKEAGEDVRGGSCGGTEEESVRRRRVPVQRTRVWGVWMEVSCGEEESGWRFWFRSFSSEECLSSLEGGFCTKVCLWSLNWGFFWVCEVWM